MEVIDANKPFEVTNIAKDGFDYKWDVRKNHSENVTAFFKKNKPRDLAEYFLKKKTLRWEGNSYREVLGTGTILEEMVLNYWKDLGDLWYQTITNGLLWEKFDGIFVIRAMNSVFLHHESDIDPQKLMNALAPAIPTSKIYHREHTDIMERNHDFPLVYFKALSDRITKAKAEEIFEDFNKDGITFLGLEAQNYLIDNNKYIRKIIEEMDLWADFPTKEARDIFIF